MFPRTEAKESGCLFRQSGRGGALFAQQAGDTAEPEGCGNERYREGDIGHQRHKAQRRNADGQFCPVIAFLPEGLAPQQGTQNEAEENRRGDERRDVHKQQYKRRAHQCR